MRGRDVCCSDDEAVEVTAGLEADYPGWHIWRGRDGSGTPCGWYATRCGASPAAREGRAGLEMTVCGEDEDELRAALDVQAEREAALSTS